MGHMILAKIKQYLNKNRPTQSLLNKALNVILSNNWHKRAQDILYFMTKNIKYSEIKLTVTNYYTFVNVICHFLRSEADDSVGWKLLNAELKNGQSHKIQTLPFIDAKVGRLKLNIVSYIKILKETKDKKTRRNLELAVSACYKINNLVQYSPTKMKKTKLCKEYLDDIEMRNKTKQRRTAAEGKRKLKEARKISELRRSNGLNHLLMLLFTIIILYFVCWIESIYLHKL